MVTFSLSLPPSNREPGDVVRAADHNETVTAVSDLAQQAGENLTALHGELAQLVTTDDLRLSNPRPPTSHTHPVSDLNTYGQADGTTFLRGDGMWAQPPATGGVTDHSALSNLDADDHPQYLNVTRGDYRYPQKDHQHGVGDLNVGGSADVSTFLRGDGQWAEPPEDPYLDTLRNGLTVNVADYGAVGDYATDDTAAFDAAIADLESRALGKAWNILHPALKVPRGGYVFTSRLNKVEFPGLTIIGEGSRSTSFIWDGTGPLFEFGTFAATGDRFAGGAHDYQFHGVKFRADAHTGEAENGARPGVAIQDNGSGGARLYDVGFIGFGTGFLAAHGSDFDVLDACYFEWCDEGAYFGPSSQQLSLSRCTFVHNGEGLVVDRAPDGKADTCWFINNYTADVTFYTSETSRHGVATSLSEANELTWTIADGWFETGAGSLNAIAPRAIRFHGDSSGQTASGVHVVRSMWMPGGPTGGQSLAFVEYDGTGGRRVTVDGLTIRGGGAEYVYRTNGVAPYAVVVKDWRVQDGYAPPELADVVHEQIKEVDTSRGLTRGLGMGARWELWNAGTQGVRLRLRTDGVLAVPHWDGTSWLEYMTLEPSSARIGLRGEFLGRAGNHDYSRSMLRTSGDFAVSGRFGVGGTTEATAPGSVVRRLEVFDREGRSLGFVPIYDDIAP